MNFSRLSVLAVFLMMIMSVFVAMPTYNVGADEHEGGPYLNAFPTGSGGDIEDYQMSLDDSEGGANITVEATELVEGTSYIISWEIRYHPDGYHTGWWDFSAPPTSVEYFIGQEVFDDLGTGCYVFIGWLYDNDADVMIEEETWPFTLDVPLSDCEGMDECPFDDREGTPCEAEECEGAGHESEECQDYVESYCDENDDPGCYFGGPDGPSFVCGNGDEIPFDWVNDGEEDCSDGSDEQQHDSDGDRINWFDCHDGSEVWVDQVNDGVDDCPDGEDEGYGGDDYDDFGPSEAHIDVHMIDLANWEAYATGTFDPMWSDDMRAELANMCAEMMGMSGTEITLECFDEWVDRIDDGPGMGGDPDRGCPHDMDDDTCDDFREACGPDSSSKLTCFRMIFDYCDDHDDKMCHEGIASEDDGGPMFEALFAYEDEEIDSDEFLDILTAWIYGEHGGDPALYDTYTFTITMDEEGFYSLHPNFGSYSAGSPDFICGNGDEIPFGWVNDDYGDCPDGADEQWYDSETPGDTSDDCQMWNDDDCDGAFVNWFDCHDGSEIWIVAVNNGEDNCPDGEDEDHGDDDYGWYGHVFLYTGNFTDVPDSTENLVGATVDVCGYEDEANKTGVHCEPALEGFLAAGDYTVVTAGTCYYEWTDEDGDGEYDESDELSCYNYGDYTHVITNESGDVVDEIDGTVEYDLNHTMVVTREHYALRDESSNSFPLYDTHAFTVDTDGFNGAIVSAQYQCYDENGDGVDDDCYPVDLALYLYEGSFDPADTHANLLASGDYVDDYNLDCPAGKYDEGDPRCEYSRLEIELSAGDYVVVTAGSSTWSEGSYKNDIVTDDGNIIDSWYGKLEGSYWEWNETDEGEGLYQTVAYDGSVYDLAFEEFWNEAYDFEWEGNQKAVEEEFGSVNDLYEIYGDVLETEGSDCDGCTGNLDTMDADTSFDITDQNEFENWAYNYDFDYYYFQFMDDNENGVYDSGEIYAVSSEGYDETGGQEVLVEGDERAEMPRPSKYSDQDGEAFFDSILDNIREYQDGTLSADVAAGNLVSIFHEADAAGLFNDPDDECYDAAGNQVDCSDDGADCPFDSMDFCYEIGPSCDFEGPDYAPWRCGSESAHYCMEDGSGDVGCDPEGIAQSCENGEFPQEICDAFNNFDHDAYHAETDDEPITLDGVEGVEDPDDWDDLMTPSSENIVGGLAEYEGTSIMFHSSFTITFDSVDDNLASHVFVIPSNADEDDDYDDDDLDWQITFTVTDGYQIDSCDGCDDINDATYSDDGHTVFFTYNSDATHDVAITFSVTAEPGPDCDYVVGIDASGFAFDSSDLEINAGETVCWQWENTVDQHNVVEIVGEFDAAVNLTEVSVGFSSGEPSNDVDFRHTFTEDDKTYYYVCEPHATMGMVGMITVGEGTPDDPVEEIEESGLPSVGFVVGALVLVGAAGLRRRIH